ncbi:MAG TPA: hypothetical protein ENK18_19770, partial [Deltaproteobacteria bacterium]|nr:hypothetical protein [Deltaproteobacteria bacterium]
MTRCWVVIGVLLAPVAGAEGLSDGLAGQILSDQVQLNIDVLDPVLDTIRFSGTGTLILSDPLGAQVATLSDGGAHPPAMAGVYTAALSSATDDWEITVDGAAAGRGRIWSTRWIFDAGSFTNGHTGSFYALVDGGGPGLDAVVEFAAEGWAGFQWELSANRIGVEGANGRSVPSVGATFTPEFPLYLNPPEGAAYTSAVPGLTSTGISAGSQGCDHVVPGVLSGSFLLTSDVDGTAHVLCDLDGIGGLDPTSDGDLHLIAPVGVGANALPWDGLDSSGGAVAAGGYSCEIWLTVGEFHYGALDVETSYPGFRLFQVDGAGARSALPMFFNDAAVQGSAVLMPDGTLGLESSGGAGLSGGLYADPVVPNVNARAWGDFSGGGKGNSAFIDTYTWVRRTISSTLTVSVLTGVEDTDGDGLLDHEEACELGTDPDASDTDGDGLSDDQELSRPVPTDPTDPDSDGDGLLDGDEVLIHGTDPVDADSDGDGLLDGDEVLTHSTDPVDADSDDDGLPDGDEIDGDGALAAWGPTDPGDPDSDGDGLPDGLEVGLALGGPDTDPGGFAADADPASTTDPGDPDSDGDGLLDGDEDANADGMWTAILGGTGTPGSGESDPLLADTDGDGLLDGDEVANGA